MVEKLGKKRLRLRTKWDWREALSNKQVKYERSGIK